MVLRQLIMFQGEDLKKRIGAVAYLECSSKTQEVRVCSTCICHKSILMSLLLFGI